MRALELTQIMGQPCEFQVPPARLPAAARKRLMNGLDFKNGPVLPIDLGVPATSLLLKKAVAKRHARRGTVAASCYCIS